MASSAAGSHKRRRDKQNGGYDYDFVDTIPSKYNCSICSKVLRDAHLTVCCGQHFCASCPFKDAGCTKKIARKDMEDHMTANQQKHIVQGYLSLQHSNEQQKQELNATRQELQATKQEFHITQSDLQAAKEELNTTKQEFKATNKELDTTKQELQATKQELQATKEELQTTEQELQTTKDELHATKQELNTTKQVLHYTNLELRGASFEFKTYD